MLSNAYFLAKFRFDTAENEPAKNLQNFANFPNFANPNPMNNDPRRRRTCRGKLHDGFHLLAVVPAEDELEPELEVHLLHRCLGEGAPYS